MNDALKAGMRALREHMAREVEKAPVPPDEVLARTITRRDVQQYDVYFIWGPGRDIASRTDCGHGYYLTDSCPGCDADDDTQDESTMDTREKEDAGDRDDTHP